MLRRREWYSLSEGVLRPSVPICLDRLDLAFLAYEWEAWAGFGLRVRRCWGLHMLWAVGGFLVRYVSRFARVPALNVS